MGNPRILPCDAAAIRAAVSVPACAARRSWVLAAAVLGSTLAYIDESVVNVALPRLESDLRATLSAMQWVINAYTLCMSALLLIGGAAADQFGRRRVFLIGIAVRCGLTDLRRGARRADARRGTHAPGGRCGTARALLARADRCRVR
jgi:hypothetical protein